MPFSRALTLATVLLATACTADSRGMCLAGRAGCPCAEGACAPGLRCDEGTCRPDNDLPCGGTCGADEVCDGELCVLLPESCPCPLESYCHVETNTCRAGCREDGDCASGRICEASRALCRAGCRADADCGAGSICEDTTCEVGCRDDASCGPGSICEGGACRIGCRSDEACGAGQTCVDGTCLVGCGSDRDCSVSGTACIERACTCTGSLTFCEGACRSFDTVQHCGACGRSCGADERCVAGRCECEPGVCGPQRLAEGWFTGALGFHGGYVYFDDGGLSRVPLDGSSPQEQVVADVRAWAIGPDGTLAYTLSGSLGDELWVAGPDGTGARRLAQLRGVESRELTVLPDWVVVRGRFELTAWPLGSTGSMRELSTTPRSGGVVGGDGAVYFAQGSWRDVALMRWTPGSAPTRVAVLPSTGTDGAVRVDVGPAHAYVGAGEPVRVRLADGTFEVVDGWPGPEAVADADGLLWAATGSIQRLDLGSTTSRSVHPMEDLVLVLGAHDGFLYWVTGEVPSVIWRERGP